MPTTWKTISLNEQTFNEIKRLSEATHRTMDGTITWLVEMTKQEKRYSVMRLDPMSTSPDAEPVPLVLVREVEP